MSEELAEAKQRLRVRMARLRGGVEPETASKAARAAASTLMSLDCASGARQMGLYAALPDELGTRSLFDAVVSAGIAACFPRTPASDAAPLEFARVDRWDAMREGRHRVLEPADEARPVAFGPHDVVVVPGVAFDAHGCRLGRGKGYYDRTFAVEAPEAIGAPTLIGFAYEFQLVDRVPSGARDRHVDAVVTECGLHGEGLR